MAKRKLRQRRWLRFTLELESGKQQAEPNIACTRLLPQARHQLRARGSGVYMSKLDWNFVVFGSLLTRTELVLETLVYLPVYHMT
jgi:hypothetical protein